MGELLNPAISIGPAALLLGLLFALGCLAFYSLAAAPKRDVSRLRFILVTLAVGVGAFVVGAALGIAAFCSTRSAGNLCGLGGVLGVGPLLAGLCMGGYAYIWLRGARNSP